jgi:hypothetical protein
LWKNSGPPPPPPPRNGLHDPRTQALTFITGEMGLSQLGDKRGQSLKLGKKKAKERYGLRSTRRSGGGL